MIDHSLFVESLMETFGQSGQAWQRVRRPSLWGHQGNVVASSGQTSSAHRSGKRILH
jgi:hypothetical protein